MKTGYILTVCILLGTLASCEKKGNQQIYDEVMAIHDEVMPKMDDIRRYKKDFQAELANNTTITEARKTQLESSIVMLDSADDGMRKWMRKFDPIADSEGEEKARKYLEDQKEKVTKVKDDILKALEEAKKLKGQ